MKIPEKSLEKKGKKPREVKRKTQRKFARSKKDEKFFEKIKEFLKEKDFELEDILGFGKNQFVLLINKDNRKRILVAYNKQRVNEKDLSNASKIAERYGLRYVVLSKSGILKKIKDIIDSSKNMDSADIL